MGMPSEKDEILPNDNSPYLQLLRQQNEVRPINETVPATPKQRETKTEGEARLKAKKLELYREYCERNKIE